MTLNPITRIRRAETPFWRVLKQFAKSLLTMHVPATGSLRPFWRAMYGIHVIVRESWIWARRFFWQEPLFRAYCHSVGSRFRIEELPYIQGIGQVVIGDGVTFTGKPQLFFNNRHRDRPQLSIGDGCFIGHWCTFRVAESIRVGRHCLFASGVSVADYDGHPLEAAARRRGETSAPSEIRPVTIGDDVWIGTGATILKGITIGDRAIVAAGAVVTKDVLPDTVVAGNPARMVKCLAALNGVSSAIDPSLATVGMGSE